jgi:hypothetical protein
MADQFSLKEKTGVVVSTKEVLETIDLAPTGHKE